jgi:hypothetical protein
VDIPTLPGRAECEEVTKQPGHTEGT